jgi:hypothetical protein
VLPHPHVQTWLGCALVHWRTVSHVDLARLILAGRWRGSKSPPHESHPQHPEFPYWEAGSPLFGESTLSQCEKSHARGALLWSKLEWWPSRTHSLKNLLNTTAVVAAWEDEIALAPKGLAGFVELAASTPALD